VADGRGSVGFLPSKEQAISAFTLTSYFLNRYLLDGRDKNNPREVFFRHFLKKL
jgi:hypothetical protein